MIGFQPSSCAICSLPVRLDDAVDESQAVSLTISVLLFILEMNPKLARSDPVATFVFEA